MKKTLLKTTAGILTAALIVTGLAGCGSAKEDKAAESAVTEDAAADPAKAQNGETADSGETTVNPENRYIKSAYIKNTQNTRLSYLRSIKLGGQKEKLYDETNIYEMEFALRRAGRVGLHD